MLSWYHISTYSCLPCHKFKRKHQNLEAELDNKQNRINDVVKAGEDMVDGDHFASDDIKAKVWHSDYTYLLSDCWQLIKPANTSQGEGMGTVGQLLLIFIVTCLMY